MSETTNALSTATHARLCAYPWWDIRFHPVHPKCYAYTVRIKAFDRFPSGNRTASGGGHTLEAAALKALDRAEASDAAPKARTNGVTLRLAGGES